MPSSVSSASSPRVEADGRNRSIDAGCGDATHVALSSWPDSAAACLDNLLSLPKKPGMTLITSGFSTRTQQHINPTDTSTADHMTENEAW
jgi:hypothetical protein